MRLVDTPNLRDGVSTCFNKRIDSTVQESPAGPLPPHSFRVMILVRFFRMLRGRETGLVQLRSGLRLCRILFVMFFELFFGSLFF